MFDDTLNDFFNLLDHMEDRELAQQYWNRYENKVLDIIGEIIAEIQENGTSNW